MFELYYTNQKMIELNKWRFVDRRHSIAELMDCLSEAWKKNIQRGMILHDRVYLKIVLEETDTVLMKFTIEVSELIRPLLKMQLNNL